MSYKEKGICIFCGETEPAVSFNNRPHTTPKSLGSKRIGFDICDSCNAFFGAPDKSMTPHIAVETSVKEIFGLIRFMINLSREGHENDRLPSIYFNFWRTRNVLEIKKGFNSSSFNRVFLKQFKRGLYELFLQEYHRETKNGHDSRFDKVRKYARYGIGDLKVWHLQSSVLLLERDISEPKFNFTDHQLREIDDYGFYSFYLWGFYFYLEVTPRAELYREDYLSNEKKKLNVGGFAIRKLVELTNICDIDFTLQMLYGRG